MSNYDPVPGADGLYQLVANINQWGLDRNITADGGATVMSQMSKMTEEFAEFLQTWDRLATLQYEIDKFTLIGDWEYAKRLEEREAELKDTLNDDFGDMLTCLINAMRLADTDMETCLSKSWEDIKDRKGRMEGGKFIKES